MRPAYQSTIESGGASSSEDLHSGLIYTSAYYEEEQLYSEIFEPTHQRKQRRTTPCVNPPVQINEHCTTNIDLPPILWHGYKTVPKILSLTNTGRTILINGQWVKGRPYIEGGPLNGTYIFSQIHFHSPSEHEIGGKRYPLEMHVVHYKTSYLTQERAMRERDGTVVLVYLFQVLDTTRTDMSSLTKLAPKIDKVNSQTETKDVSLEQIVKPFTSNYYVYWGSVSTGKSSYILQWIVSGCILYVTKQEADELLGIMNFGEINVKSLPRMKPENNAIYYVEEIEQDKHEHEHECTTCRSYQEWWLYQCSHTCHSKDETDVHNDDSSTNLQFCFCKREEDCRSQPVLSGKKNPFTRRNFSGLRICRHKKRKLLRKFCEPHPVAVCCPKTGEEVCVCPKTGEEVCVCPKTEEVCVCPKTEEVCVCPKAEEVCVCPEPEHVESCQANKVLSTKETTSCPSPTAEAETTRCTEKPECEADQEVVKVKVVCSCPSVKDCKSSNQCEEEIKVKVKKKKKMDTCKDVSKNMCKPTSSTQATKNKQNKKKNQKKEDSCDEGSPSSGKKKSSTPKKTKKSDSECDANNSTSKVSTNSKKAKKKASEASQDCNKEKEIPVECITETITDKSFDEILREYDTTWLEDSRLKISKTDSTEFFDNTKSMDIVSLKKPVLNDKNPDDNAITTIFEKKREPKTSEPPAEDYTVNFLLKPNSRKSNPSSPFMSPKSVSEELKCVDTVSTKGINVPDVTVNTVTLSGVRIPTENPNELPKEFCVQVELLFHSNNKDFSECVTQEYNLALMYNQNILQEYRGTLCPNSLQIGNYEKLELVPKYPELDNIRIHLQDCTVKMESSDQLCMRAKFLMKELNFKNLDMIGEQDGEENGDKKIIVLSDAVTQCSVKEFDKPRDIDILEKITLQAKVSEFPQETITSEEPKSSNNRINFSTPRSQLSLEQKNLKNEALQNENCNVESITPGKKPSTESGSKKPNFSGEDSKNSNSIEDDGKKSNSSEEAEKKESIGKEITKKAVKELKSLFSNKKKTVYFMYEKVEKDETSGRKVFVGSFRSKDDVKSTSKDKKSVNNEKKLLLLSAKDSTNSSDLTPVQNLNERELRVHSPTQSKNLLNDKKDLVTLHKFKPKHLRVNDSKKEQLNLVVGKALNQLQKESKNFKRLAELIGVDEEENSKISVYELQESSENDTPVDSSYCSAMVDNRSSKKPSIMVVSDMPSQRNISGGSSETESLLVGGRKSLLKKGSQSAVLIIPVEVDSMSKVEVILVEHAENVEHAKKTVLKRGREIIPCLDY